MILEALLIKGGAALLKGAIAHHAPVIAHHAPVIAKSVGAAIHSASAAPPAVAGAHMGTSAALMTPALMTPGALHSATQAALAQIEFTATKSVMHAGINHLPELYATVGPLRASVLASSAAAAMTSQFPGVAFSQLTSSHPHHVLQAIKLAAKTVRRIRAITGSELLIEGGSLTEWARRIETDLATRGAADGRLIQFTVTKHVEYGDHIGIVGSIPKLGEWHPTQAVWLAWAPGDQWTGRMQLPISTHSFEYKRIIRRAGGGILWEQGTNHRTTASTPVIQAAWN